MNGKMKMHVDFNINSDDMIVYFHNKVIWNRLFWITVQKLFVADSVYNDCTDISITQIMSLNHLSFW